METLFETTHNLLGMLEIFSNSKDSFIIRKRKKTAAKKAARLNDDLQDEEPAVEDSYEDDEVISQKIVERKFQFSTIESVIKD